jgi:hypothetical protein
MAIAMMMKMMMMASYREVLRWFLEGRVARALNTFPSKVAGEMLEPEYNYRRSSAVARAHAMRPSTKCRHCL